MDRLAALKTFVEVARHGSFSEAARRLHVSPTAASRAIGDLEASLGVLLLRRTTRTVVLTPEGAAYLESCRTALDELDGAERSLRGENAEPRGKLTITSSEMFGRLHILPIVRQLLSAYPDLEAELILTQRLVKMAEEGIDIAVRIADLSDSALHAVRVVDVHRVLVASPDYLAARGTPTDVAHLHAHDLIMYDNFAPNREWRFGPTNKIVVKIEPRLVTNVAAAAIDYARGGGGIARALCYQVAADVAAGRLAYVLPDLTPPAVPVNLVFQANRSGSPNVRAFVAAAKRYFHPGLFDCATHS